MMGLQCIKFIFLSFFITLSISSCYDIKRESLVENSKNVSYQLDTISSFDTCVFVNENNLSDKIQKPVKEMIFIDKRHQKLIIHFSENKFKYILSRNDSVVIQGEAFHKKNNNPEYGGEIMVDYSDDAKGYMVQEYLSTHKNRQIYFLMDEDDSICLKIETRDTLPKLEYENIIMYRQRALY